MQRIRENTVPTARPIHLSAAEFDRRARSVSQKTASVRTMNTRRKTRFLDKARGEEEGSLRLRWEMGFYRWGGLMQAASGRAGRFVLYTSLSSAGTTMISLRRVALLATLT